MYTWPDQKRSPSMCFSCLWVNQLIIRLRKDAISLLFQNGQQQSLQRKIFWVYFVYWHLVDQNWIRMLPVFCCSQWWVWEDQKEQSCPLGGGGSTAPLPPPHVEWNFHVLDSHRPTAPTEWKIPSIRFFSLSFQKHTLFCSAPSAGLSSVWHTPQLPVPAGGAHCYKASCREPRVIGGNAWSSATVRGMAGRRMMASFLCTWLWPPQSSKTLLLWAHWDSRVMKSEALEEKRRQCLYERFI